MKFQVFLGAYEPRRPISDYFHTSKQDSINKITIQFLWIFYYLTNNKKNHHKCYVLIRNNYIYPWAAPIKVAVTVYNTNKLVQIIIGS